MILVGTGQSAPGAAASYVGNTFTDSTNTLRKAASAIVRPPLPARDVFRAS
jgi:hypothetical protein